MKNIYFVLFILLLVANSFAAMDASEESYKPCKTRRAGHFLDEASEQDSSDEEERYSYLPKKHKQGNIINKPYQRQTFLSSVHKGISTVDFRSLSQRRDSAVSPTPTDMELSGQDSVMSQTPIEIEVTPDLAGQDSVMNQGAKKEIPLLHNSQNNNKRSDFNLRERFFNAIAEKSDDESSSESDQEDFRPRCSNNPFREIEESFNRLQLSREEDE